MTFQSPLPVPRETFPSFFSRLAASKGTSNSDFAIDMGLSLRRVWETHPSAVEAVALWGQLSDTQISELVSWTGQRIGKVRMTFRNEVFVSRALRSPTMRGCPACLREDFDVRVASPEEAMAMRGDWQLREQTICLRHCRLLVDLWQIDDLAARYDFPSRLTDIRQGLTSHQLDGLLVEPTAFDFWLDGRLNNRTDGTWLCDKSLYAGAVFCRLLGAELLKVQSQVDAHASNDMRAAQTVGFNVVKNGQAAVEAALDFLAAASAKSLGEPQKTFGSLFVKLRTDYKDEKLFDPFREMLRDCILRHWPIAENEDVLGERLQIRMLHSLTTSARKFKIDHARMRRLLIKIGAVDSSDDRLPNRQVFDAQKYEAELGIISSLVTFTRLRKVIGASRYEAEALVADGLLRPFSGEKAIRANWPISSGFELISGLEAKAVVLQNNAGAYEALLMARNRSGLSFQTIIDAVLHEDLPLYLSSSEVGFSSFLVSKRDIEALKRSLAENGGGSVISASEFGRDIGYRDTSRIEALARAGHLGGFWRQMPGTTREQLNLAADDIAQFHRRFVTHSSFAKDNKVSWNTVRSWFKSAELCRFSPDGQDFGMLFLREDAERARRLSL